MEYLMSNLELDVRGPRPKNTFFLEKKGFEPVNWYQILKKNFPG